MPFDAEPVLDGTYELKPEVPSRDGTDPWIAVYVPPAKRDLEPVPRFVPHFATCPDAAAFRRRP